MTGAGDEIVTDYRAALAAYVAEPDEAGRARAYELGHRAVEAKLGLLDLAAVHRSAVGALMTDETTRALVVASVEFLTESLSTFEMAQRGYREAQERAAIEHDIALTLQRSLLPTDLPVPEGLRVAVRYLPAGGHVAVGGDWYDVVPLGGPRTAVVVGDVMGHGIRQAAVMGQMRLGLRAYLVGGYPLDEVVQRTDSLLQSLGDTQTATMVLGVVDLAGPTFALANAGHPPPLLVGADGGAQYVTEGHGRLLGLALTGGRPVHGPVDLPTGATLLMYTDGLVERHERAGDDAYAVLRDAVEGFSGPPDELCDLVTAAMVDDEPTDDICLLAVTVPPLAPSENG